MLNPGHVLPRRVRWPWGWLLTGSPYKKMVATGSAAAVAVGGLGYGVYKASTSSGGGAGPGTAHIWVDTNGGTCVDNASAVTYSDATACGSFDAANDTCDNNDVVLVKNGSYGTQTITGSNSRSAMCNMSAENTADDSVTFSTLTTNGDWMTISHMDSHTGETTHAGSGGCYWCNQEGGSNLVLDDVNLWGKWTAGEISGGTVHNPATNVTWKNSHLGTPGNTAIRMCGLDDEPFRISEANNTRIAYNTFHTWRAEGSGGACGSDTYHLETFRLWDTIDGLKFIGNYFDDDNGDDSFTLFNGKGGCSGCPPNDNVVIVNNYFGDKCCGYAATDISFGQTDGCAGAVIAYNFFHDQSAGLFTNCSNQSTFKYVGNMGYNPGGCPTNGTNTNNLWIGTSHGTCASNSWLSGGADTWTSYLLSGPYQLTASSPSINAGENTVCSTYAENTDINGQTRTGVCDAGPDEYIP